MMVKDAPSLIVHKGTAVHIEAPSLRITILNILLGTARPEPNPPVTHAQTDAGRRITGPHLPEDIQAILWRRNPVPVLNRDRGESALQ
jgi:hypothetical protein